jgi:hypothetical protein
VVFADSSAPDLTESIPTPLARRITEAAGYTQNGCKFDVAIGGLPFMFAINDQRQYQRQTADFRKQQLDTSKEPGEQSLDQWWVRDQASWHRGAGVVFYEPGSDDGTAYRYKDSVGVDVWTKGQMTLLHSLASIGTVSAAQVSYATTGVLADGTDVVFLNQNGTVKRHNGTSATNYTGATGTSRVAVAGSTILVGTSNSIASGSISGTTLTNLWTSAPSAPSPHWVKSRIIAATANSLWELTLAGGAWPATATYAHPDASWTWTSVTEAPNAILAAGYSGAQSAIYSFTLETDGSGAVPKLGQPFQVAEFPPGEQVHSLRVYLGTYVAIGTSKGVRIGILGDNGTIQQGPLVFSSTQPVRALNARDSYVYAGVTNQISGNSGVVRINLAESVDDTGLRFAYANDVQTHATGQVDSVAFLGNTDRVVVGVRGVGAYLQSATVYETNGYLLSGAMRFATTEAKAFRRAKIRTATNAGTVAFSSIDRGGTEATIFTLGDAYNTDSDIAITSPTTGQPYLLFRLVLSSNETHLTTPVVEGLQIKALPQLRRQRLLSLPLMCIDREKDRNGVMSGYKGGAANRLFALEELEDLQAVVQIEDFTAGESFQAQIESVQMDRNTPPSRRGGNFGGYITVVVRRL